MLYKRSFRMSGQSPLTSVCLIVFPNTNFIYMSIDQYISEFSRKFHGMQISRLHISACKNALAWNFEGSLVEHQSYSRLNFMFLAVQEPNFPNSKIGQNRPLTGF